MLMLKIATNL